MSDEIKKFVDGLRGRPTKLTVETIRKIEEAASVDASIKEICYYAQISRDTYYRWIKDFPFLDEKIRELRLKPVLKARQEVIKGLEGSPMFALQYLKAKRPEEFGERKVKYEVAEEKINESDDPEADKIRQKYEEELRQLSRKKQRNS